MQNQIYRSALWLSPGGNRFHPAVMAEAIATLRNMYGDRLLWIAAGSGAIMNEHVTDTQNHLYCLKENKLDPVVSKLNISNGFGFAPDGKIFYLTDTGNNTIWRYDYNEENGLPYNQSIFAQPSKPDGMAIDAEGYIFSAQFGEGIINVYAPSGELDETYTLPVKNVTSCCFGGKNLKTLYITTAEGDEPDSGSIFTGKVSRPGLATARCKL